jgi:hypothetical protein
VKEELPISDNTQQDIEQKESDDLHKIRISCNVQVAIRKSKEKNIDILQEILMSDIYDVEYKFEAKNSYVLDRDLYFTNDMYNRFGEIAKEHVAKDLNEAITRLWQGYKKQVAEESKKAKSPSKKKKAIYISHPNSDDAPPNAL